jgi:hypothetical protein
LPEFEGSSSICRRRLELADCLPFSIICLK